MLSVFVQAVFQKVKTTSLLYTVAYKSLYLCMINLTITGKKAVSMS